MWVYHLSKQRDPLNQLLCYLCMLWNHPSSYLQRQILGLEISYLLKSGIGQRYLKAAHALLLASSCILVVGQLGSKFYFWPPLLHHLNYALFLYQAEKRLPQQYHYNGGLEHLLCLILRYSRHKTMAQSEVEQHHLDHLTLLQDV